MKFEKLKLDINDGIASLTLNDPDVLNAVSVQMIEELNKAVDLVEDPESGARCLVLTGTGRAFCSGANLADKHPFTGHSNANHIKLLIFLLNYGRGTNVVPVIPNGMTALANSDYRRRPFVSPTKTRS